MHRLRAALRRRVGKATGIAIAALVLLLMPGACLCAPTPSVPAVAHHDCHRTADAPARPAPAHRSDCQHCQAVIAPTSGQQAPAAPVTVAFSISPAHVPTSLARPTTSITHAVHRSGHPPARALLLHKHVLII